MIFALSCSRGYDPAITSQDLLKDLRFLAGDSLKGRYPGTPEDSLLREYIADKFKMYGLIPLNDNYIEYFDVIASIKPAGSNRLVYGEKTFRQDIDYLPMEYSSDDTLSARVEFCGYGFEIRTDSLTWDDYKGKDLMVSGP